MSWAQCLSLLSFVSLASLVLMVETFWVENFLVTACLWNILLSGREVMGREDLRLTGRKVPPADKQGPPHCTPTDPGRLGVATYLGFLQDSAFACDHD